MSFVSGALASVVRPAEAEVAVVVKSIISSDGPPDQAVVPVQRPVPELLVLLRQREVMKACALAAAHQHRQRHRDRHRHNCH